MLYCRKFQLLGFVHVWSFFKNKQLNKIDHRSDNAKHFANPSIVIKIPVTKWKRAQSWGDYHMAVLLKQQLERNGHRVLIQILPEWNNKEGLKYDVAIVFRGLSRYIVKPQQINIMWNISHPDDVTVEEYQDYDQVFIASNYWAKVITKKISVPVEVMLQCTDTDRFKEPNEQQKTSFNHQLLFVGNSRDIYRKSLKDLLPTEYDLAVYGKNWEKILAKDVIKGTHVSNDELYKYYGSADILLNDHWDDMREKGFVSNRLYDGLACGAFIITDLVKEMGGLKEYVQTYETAEELKAIIKYYLDNPEERNLKSQEGIRFIHEDHTFKARAKQFSSVILKFDMPKKKRTLFYK